MKFGATIKALTLICTLGPLAACEAGPAAAPAEAAAATLAPGIATYLTGSDQQPRRFLLGRYTYAPGEMDLPPEAKPAVAALAAALKADPVQMVAIESYAAEGGGSADDHLGAKRAHRFAKALEAAGVEKRRILATAGRPMPGGVPADPGAQAPVSNGRTDVILYRDFSYIG